MHQRERVEVVQAEWHPLSPFHVVVLTSDSELSVFDVRGDRERPTFRLRPVVLLSYCCHTAVTALPHRSQVPTR